ncbi:cytochrome c peroxidase [Mesobacillus maritimus]|uniref:cytochrome c peroxidase n=1 Tax=Mesobacillus maritimus TaxID=1643336 RepID=UPI00385054A7
MKQVLMLILLTIVSLIGCSSNTDEATNSAVLRIKEEKAEEKSLDQMKSALLSNGMLIPLGEIPIPDDNPMDKEVVELGQMLFFDSRLSGNNERSCATCHDPEKGYGDGRATFETVDGGEGARNSPTIINSGYYTTNFWDGRAESLEEQALGPIENPDEMDQPLNELVNELKAIKRYEELFAAAFPDGITEQNIAKALAAFQRLIVVKDTPYDQFLNGDSNALTDSELRGMNLFAGKAFCSTCHQGENLSDNNFYNIGITTEDVGRFAVTGEEGDIGRIRTPSLYGISHTAPYMRDGSLETLEAVIDYYNRGGDGHPNTSFFIKQFMSPLGLTYEEKADLLAFLNVLGGEPPIYSKPELP